MMLFPLFSLLFAGTMTADAQGSTAVIKGVVRSDGGGPIADATVAIFRAGTATLLKQVQSASDGSFLARIAPGKYTVLAVAQGFNPVTLSEVEVLRAAQLTYGFKLERSGSGNTLPERRLDRSNPKWARRAATLSRTIYQNSEGEEPLTTDEEVEESTTNGDGRKAQYVAETYLAGDEDGSYVGVNFATLLPVTEDVDLVLAAQTGAGKHSPQRIEAQSRFRASDDHQLRLNTSFGKLGTLSTSRGPETLNQLSLQATDEWRIREGVVFVFGFDYARFVGAGNDFSISPRLGFQYDLNAKTRVRTAFTTQNDSRNWMRTIELEDAQVMFREPVSMDDVVVESGKPVLNRSSRFEVGFERVLDNRSSINTNFFVDTVYSRGIGMQTTSFASSQFAVNEFTGNQQGEAQGISVVYSRRLTGRVSTSAGFSFGRGQRLADGAITTPVNLFENSLFQTFFGQIDADFRTGTNVKAVFRLSPEATFFAIDPFQGRLAIYDPSLSVMITQNLPTLGLPIHAEAMVDARNLFDVAPGVNNEDGSLRLNGQGRTLRGGILVRF